MKCAVDLHMHSCLSPCADDDMTPNNIVGMAFIKQLDCIAVTDHNAAFNLPAAKAVADAMGVVLLPGIEVTSSEEVHILTYFADVDTAVDFGKMVYDHLPPLPNNKAIFGNQLILDEDDEPVGELDKLLIQATDLSIEDIAAACEAAGGACVAAHINRSSNSLLANLGFLPERPVFSALEVYRAAPAPVAPTGEYKILYASDAHRLGDISEREFFLDLPERSTQALFDYLLACRQRVLGN